jgi:hypothetical protein
MFFLEYRRSRHYSNTSWLVLRPDTPEHGFIFVHTKKLAVICEGMIHKVLATGTI